MRDVRRGGWTVSKTPWFKFYGADFLLDLDVDDLPLEAQAILVRMWCVVSMDGFIPADESEIARRCRLKADQVLHLHLHLQKLLQFFVPFAEGLLTSERMQREQEHSKQLSAIRSDAARHKHSKRVAAIAPANVDANGPAKTMQSESKSESNKKPTNSDEVIWRIAKLHPGNDHLKSEYELSSFLRNVLVQRCTEDGWEAVESGTAAFRRVWDSTPEEKRAFLSGELKKPLEFFKSFSYRKYSAKPAVEDRLGETELRLCERFDISTDGRALAEVRDDIEQARMSRQKEADHVA
jgi:hypothetical protein